ncbi:hypothetical protein [Leifsonia shinshuensis]|uniref:Transposase n=1 Tax=Leifsonia shinshuensis TaxID=150026 RepID=A0A7G6YBM2_9MICO|nr:hypothetical protein [Leifsonia shinshuensis]QNE35887.1 hypothetical protein F1C12_12615 [Leifsonia shinshuensis]
MNDLVEGFGIDTDLLLNEVELRTFSGSRSVFPHSEVLTTNKCIEMTGVLCKLEEWRLEDRGGKQASGPAPYVTDRAILVIMLMLAREHKPLNETAIAEVMHRRLTDESREFLDLPHALPSSPLKPKGSEEKNWQNHAYNGFHRILNPMDPHPDTKGSRRRLLNNAERDAIRTARDLNTMRRRKERLDWFSQQFVQMTFTMQPRRLRRLQTKANISIDQTPVAVYTKRGHKDEFDPNERAERLVKEMDAAWYVKPGKKYVWGYAANFAVSTSNIPGQNAGFPITIRAFTLSVPNVEITGEAVRLGKQLVDAGHEPGRMTIDRGYPGGSDSDSNYTDDNDAFHKRVRELGFSRVFDYKRTELGKKPGGQNGSIYVEGEHLCPATPDDLVNASIRAQNLEIGEAEYRFLIEERSSYSLRNKETPDADGKVKKMCPALGPQAKIECPLRAIHPKSSQKAKPRVLKRNLPERLDNICCNTSATFVETDETLKFKQDLRYGSPEWQTTYTADRNMVEGVNGYIKDEGKENLGSAARRSAAGIAAQQVLVTMLVVSANMRKLQSFLKEESKTALQAIAKVGRRIRRRDQYGTYKRKWGPDRDFIELEGRDDPIDIRPLRT